MSYIDNLRGVLQTKVDALNAMDLYRSIARTPPRAEAETPRASSAPPGGAGLRGLVITAAVALAGALIAGAANRNEK